MAYLGRLNKAIKNGYDVYFILELPPGLREDI